MTLSLDNDISKYREELINIRNRITEIRDKVKPEVSNNIKEIGTSDLSRLCSIINSLDNIILHLNKIKWMKKR